jgi:hypothetical protein
MMNESSIVDNISPKVEASRAKCAVSPKVAASRVERVVAKQR